MTIVPWLTADNPTATILKTGKWHVHEQQKVWFFTGFLSPLMYGKYALRNKNSVNCIRHDNYVNGCHDDHRTMANCRQSNSYYPQTGSGMYMSSKVWFCCN
ncbi:hypothetical protein CEXT_575901 [Caerostris extrusa]|uniref:Uncharacterized protein n=1 Tax=Caerostris extrusa TaxID=172846 RepID=A0AAV4NRN0_CAEEX|nr:hypothetical protein CEXT_575901 [Caerostris extrusa]